MAPLVGRQVKVRAMDPFPFSRAGDTSQVALRFTTFLEGRVQRVAGDTLVLARGLSDATSVDASFRHGREVVSVVRTPATEVVVTETDWRRSWIAIGVVAVAIVGFVAYAASQIEIPLSSTP
jgi:hypothetical protein